MKWWQKKKKDADLGRELRSDLELEEEEQKEGGVPPEEARYAALRAFGNPSLLREQTRATWSGRWLESLGTRPAACFAHAWPQARFYRCLLTGDGAGHRRQCSAVHRGTRCFTQALAVL